MDLAAVRQIKEGGYAGAFIWAANTDPGVTPHAAELVPQVAPQFSDILHPQWPWGAVPNFTKCDPATGRWPGL